MADQSHLDILQQGAEAWNSWRDRNPTIEPNLTGADLSGANLFAAKLTGANLTGADLSGANLQHAELTGADLTKADLTGTRLVYAFLFDTDLSEANLSGANLYEASCRRANLTDADIREANLTDAYISEANLLYAMLRKANLTRADLYGTNLRGADIAASNLSEAKLIKANLSKAYLYGARLSGANLSEADLSEADLYGTDLSEANFSGANLSRANLRRSALLQTNLQKTLLDGCLVYGISAWGLRLEGAKQRNLNISDSDEPAVMVDNLEVAQFIYLLLNNEKIRDVIDTIGEKGVLILGRFTEERKRVLDAIRDRLRELGFVPMMFDFERPSQQDFDETIKTLAGLSRFIIADITNPKSNPLELQAIMPNYMVPFVPIIQEDEEPFAMFQGLQHKYGEWVLDVLEYDSASNLLEVLDEAVVRPALDKSDQLILKKAEAIRTRHTRDYQ